MTVQPEDIRATAAALLRAVQEMEHDSDAQSIQVTNQEPGRKPLRKYFIKRNYSGEHREVSGVTPLIVACTVVLS